jgi:hypothetical protein
MSDSMFFVSGFYNKKEPEWTMYRGHKSYKYEGSSRCFAFFPTLKEAKDLVEKRGNDIYECRYSYAIIEEMGMGYMAWSKNEWWYKATDIAEDNMEATYVPIEKPEFAQHVCNFSIG